MLIWQADFYRRPLKNTTTNQPLWELLICDLSGTFKFAAFCSQSEANAAWLQHQFQEISTHQPLPSLIQIFRPQSLTLIEAAVNPLGIRVEPTRRTIPLKQWLQERVTHYQQLETYTHQPYEPLTLDQPPPMPLPENLWGEQWRFAALCATDLMNAFTHRPIPILEMPEFLWPLNLGLASTTLIPGVVIDGARQSMRLAKWFQEIQPIALNYIPGNPDGLILEAGLVDRWVIATFTDAEVAAAANLYQQRLQGSQGLHFLLVQPDDSGMTYSGFWLLQSA